MQPVPATQSQSALSLLTEGEEPRIETLIAEFERLSEKGQRSAPQMIELLMELKAEMADLRRQRAELASLYQVAQDLAAASDLEELLESIMDKAIVLVGAERGLVALVDAEEGYRISAARRFSAGEVEPSDDAFSSSLIRRVMRSGEPILTTNIQEDGRYELTQSILVQQIRSVLAVPMVARGDLQGAIYVDTRAAERPFGTAELGLLQAMASQAAMAIRGARLYDDLRTKNDELQSTLDELREAESQLVQAERLAAVGRLAASVAHELRNPLMVMRNALYFLDRLVSEGKMDTPDTFRRYFQKLDAEIERQSKIINDLLFFSRNRPRRLTRVVLDDLLTESVMKLQLTETIAVEMVFDPALEPVSADADQLQQVFVNLLANAVQAMPNGGRLSIRTSHDTYYAIVQISDTGVGISEEHQQRLFEPFFTTKERGIGLGLSVSRSIIEGHRGEIQVASRLGEGSTFTVRIPAELIG